MVTPESFGNPNNPFDEAWIADDEMAAYRMSVDYQRRPAYELILSMVCFSNSVVCEEVGGGKLKRSLAFDCTAPFAPALGMYINEAMLTLDPHEQDTEVHTMSAHILLADIIDNRQVTQRWIQLSNPEGEEFGVTGVSRRLPDGTYEKWRMLTLNMLSRPSDVPDISLWGEPVEDEDATSTLLPDTTERCIDAYRVSLSRAISRPRKRVFPDS